MIVDRSTGPGSPRGRRAGSTCAAIAAEEHVPTSALIRRILVRAVREGTKPVLTVEQVEEIARRVMRESA